MRTTVTLWSMVRSELVKLRPSISLYVFLFFMLVGPTVVVEFYNILLNVGVIQLSDEVFDLDVISSQLLFSAVYVGFYSLNIWNSEKATGLLSVTRRNSPSFAKIMTAKYLVQVAIVGSSSAVGLFVGALLARQSNASTWAGLLHSQAVQLVFAVVALVLIASLAIAISALAPTVFSGTLTFALVFLVLPPAAAALFDNSVQHASNYFPVAGLQAAVTIAPGHAFPLQGMPASSLTPTEGLTVLAIWGLGTIALAYLIGFKKPRPFVLSALHRRRSEVRVKPVTTAPTVNKTKPASLARLFFAQLVRAFSARGAKVMTTIMIGLPTFVAVSELKPQIDNLVQVYKYSSDLLSFQSQAALTHLPTSQVLYVLFGSYLYLSESTTGSIRRGLIASPKKLGFSLTHLAATFVSALTISTVTQWLIVVIEVARFNQAGFAATLLNSAVMHAIFWPSIALGLCALLGGGIALLFSNYTSAYGLGLAIFVVIPAGIFGLQAFNGLQNDALLLDLQEAFPYVLKAVTWSPPEYTTIYEDYLHRVRTPWFFMGILLGWASIASVLGISRFLRRRF